MSFNPSQQIRSHQTFLVMLCAISVLAVSIPLNKSGLIKQSGMPATFKVGAYVSIPLNKSGLIKPAGASPFEPRRQCFNPSQQIRSHQTAICRLRKNEGLGFNPSQQIRSHQTGNIHVVNPASCAGFNPSQQIRSHQTACRRFQECESLCFNPSQQIRSHQTDIPVIDVLGQWQFQSLSTNQVSSNLET